MKTEVFGGWSEKEVVDYFVSTFLTEKQVKNIGGGDGQNRLVFDKVHRLSGLSKRKTAEFIDKVINHLALKWDIQCPDPSQYYLEKSQRT